MLDSIIAFVVILIVILIWVNLQMFRPRSTKPALNGTAQSDASVEPNEPEARSAVEQSVQPLLNKEPLAVARSAGTDRIEVVAQPPLKSPKLFERPEYPFILHEAKVPEFGSDGWKRCFRQLEQDQRVLGWIAFQEETVGASDRDYEAGFIDVLRTYHRSVEKLRREVGMSAIHETSVVGEEGKVWFITAVDDAWLALFLDNQTDAKLLTDRLLEPLLRDGDRD